MPVRALVQGWANPGIYFWGGWNWHKMDLLVVISTLFAILDTTKKARVTYIKGLNCCSFGLHELASSIQQSCLSFCACLFAGSVSRWLVHLRKPRRKAGPYEMLCALPLAAGRLAFCSITCFDISVENKTETCPLPTLCVPWRRWVMAMKKNISMGVKLLATGK